MSKEKKVTLLRVLIAVMHTGALGRIPAHAATAHPENTGAAPTALTSPTQAITADDSFNNAFNNSYFQSFGDLFVLEEPWFEGTFPNWW